MTPQDAIATKRAPSGTPQRSCPGWPMRPIAKSDPSSVVAPPRTSRRGLPRARRRVGSALGLSGPAALAPPPFAFSGDGGGSPGFSALGSGALVRMR